MRITSHLYNSFSDVRYIIVFWLALMLIGQYLPVRVQNFVVLIFIWWV